MSAQIDYHQKAYICTHVFDGERPVLLVNREDGGWSLVCGDVHPQEPSSYVVVGIGHVVDRDRSLVSILDLEPEWEAERTAVGEPWIRRPSTPEP